MISAFGIADDKAILKVGDSAPQFMANDQHGNLWKSEDYIGKGNLIIYFYPVAMTGG
jgi:peroxiredoxin Q/BCP